MPRILFSSVFLICSLSFGHALEHEGDEIELEPILYQFESVPEVGSENQFEDDGLKHDLDELVSVMKILQAKIDDILSRWEVQQTDSTSTQSSTASESEAVYYEYNLY